LNTNAYVVASIAIELKISSKIFDIVELSIREEISSIPPVFLSWSILAVLMFVIELPVARVFIDANSGDVVVQYWTFTIHETWLCIIITISKVVCIIEVFRMAPNFNIF